MTEILECKVGKFLILYLGIKGGMNHRKTGEWACVTKKLEID